MTEAERIENDAKDYALTKGYASGVQIKWCAMDYTAGATAEHERLQEQLTKERKLRKELIQKLTYFKHDTGIIDKSNWRQIEHLIQKAKEL